MKLTTLFALAVVLAIPAQAAPVSHLNPRGDSWKSPISEPDTDFALLQTPYSILSSLGPYSPFLSQNSSICRDVPSGWKIDQVQIISRHGARNPTTKALTKIQSSLSLLANVTGSTDPTLAFVKDYKYGSNITADALTDFGRKELWYMGQRYAKEYAALASLYFVRADSDARVVESGQYFLQGFLGQPYDLNATKPNVNVIIGGANDTLDISSCTTYEAIPSVGSKAEASWLEVFGPPIAKRLNAALNVNISSTSTAITDFLSLCSFDSLQAQEWVQSPWCNAFTAEEFAQNEYYYDVQKFYDESWGSQYGRVLGVGLVNEIISRLNDSAVLLGSGTNSTLDKSSTTFPLNKTFYIDFSHDNNMAPILPALGLEWETDLPTQPSTNAIPPHHFVVSKLVPFAGRYVFERLVNPQGVKYIRVIVNDAVIRLNFAGCGDEGIENGLCPLSAFLQAQSYAQQVPSEWDDICYGAPLNKTVALQV